MNRTFRFVSHQMPFSRDVLMIDENRSTYFLTPERSQAIRNHSPDGFNWGYAGSGPAQLALGLLLEVTNNEQLAIAHYNDFTYEVIGAVESQETDWELEESQILEWLANRGVTLD